MAKTERIKTPLRPLFRRSVFIIVAAVLFLSTGTTRAGAAMENHFLYFPDPHLHTTPAEVGLDFEEVVFPADDGTTLHGWFVPAAADSRVILFFHGNAGNISGRVDNLAKLNQAGFSVFIFDYRGYGRSQGKTSEEGTYSDGRGALKWLQKKGYNLNQVICFGRSLGAAIALQMAIEFQPAALIMESPFISIAAMGKAHYPILYRLLGWLMSARYDNKSKISRLKSPMLLIHGSADTIVPAAMGEELFRLAPEPKRLHLIKGADHNDGFFLYEELYWKIWEDFIETSVNNS